MALVEVRDAHKWFGQHEVLRGIDARIEEGEVVVLIGPSGCGKSTLLRCLNGLETPEQGSIIIDGLPLVARARQINALRRKVGMVFQHFHLFPHLSVLDNIMLAPRRVLGLSAEEARARALRRLEDVQLAGKANAYPAQLSGGQQQRVAIARSLAMEPRLLLFDEPTSALDPELVGEVLDVIRALAMAGTTMCIVTHEMGFAGDVAGRIWFMDEGQIVESGPPAEVLRQPSHPRTREFLARLLRQAA